MLNRKEELSPTPSRLRNNNLIDDVATPTAPNTNSTFTTTASTLTDDTEKQLRQAARTARNYAAGICDVADEQIRVANQMT